MKSIMAENFSICPICKSNANFSTVNEKQHKVQCIHCQAVFQLFLARNKQGLISIKLLKTGKEKQAKSHKKTHKVLGFWQHPRIFDNSTSLEKEINKNFKRYVEISFSAKKKEKAMQRLTELGDLAVFHILGITMSIVPPPRAYISESLEVIREIANPICLPDLVRIFNSGNPLVSRQNVLKTIIDILLKLEPEIASQYKDFLIDVWGNDLDQSLRGLAMHGLRALNLLTESEMEDLIPVIIKRIEEEVDPQSRVNSIVGLGEFTNNPLVIDFLVNCLTDQSTPPNPPPMAGSLTGFLVAAAKYKPKASVGEVAANMILKSGNQKGILRLIDFILDGGLGRKIHEKKIEKLVSDRPFVIDFLYDVITREETNAKNINRKMMAREFLRIAKSTNE